MAITVIKTGVDLLKTMEGAHMRCMPVINTAFRRSSYAMSKTAKRFAPKYNNLKYPTWVGMPNAHAVGGRLRESIVSRTTSFKYSGRSVIRANTSYASYMENGFYHVRADRRVPGTSYMRSAYYTTFVPKFKRELHKAHRITFLPVPIIGV